MKWLTALLIIMIGGPAFAQCAPAQVIEDALREDYKEEVAYWGLATDGRLLRIFTSPDGGTWTLDLLQPNGLACPLASGTEWTQALPREPKAPTGPSH